MTAVQMTWTPETLRTFKEILYRFMGEVHATKAALYLKTPGNRWTLVSRYGFGRRDRLDSTFEDDHTLVRMVRAFGDDPRFYNEAGELGEIDAYLKAAGTTRLMLVPLLGPSGLIGFVDVRDKGGRRPFEPDDLELARSIAATLAQEVTEIDGDGSGRSPEDEAKTAVPAASAGDDEGDEPPAILDDVGFDEINTAASDGLVDPRVVAVALTLASARSAAIVIHQGTGTPVIDLDSLIRHQTAAMTRAFVPSPPTKGWKTEVRRTAGHGPVARKPVIATSVVLRGAGCALTASIVADSDPVAARHALERLRDRVLAAADRFRLRITRRGLARRLLQPGNRRYPELVAHSLGVSRLCWSVARVLDLDEATVEKAALAGLLHDVGMRELDYDRLYLHPTPGPEDRRTYRLHVEVGGRIVRVEGFSDVADAVRHHHERWDGNGYPDRLAGDAIPLLARIVHVAEVFDLFTAANSYRPAVSRERALAILERAAGHQFDPNVVEAIARVVA